MIKSLFVAYAHSNINSNGMGIGFMEGTRIDKLHIYRI